MKTIFLRVGLAAVFLLAPLAHAATDYQPGPDSKPQPGVPKGDVVKYTFDQSRIFPGTTRDYYLYVPKQYDPAKPACLYVCQDSIRWEATTVFDNLIQKHEMPVTIGVFVTPGVVKAPRAGALDRFNRSVEYDGLGDAYVRFLLEELLPDVEKKTAPDGRPIHLSPNANDRMIAGGSSGAIAAFTAAWERPDAFSRVFSSIGTYVGLRGGDVYPILIRKFEPKPIRVFLQDGSNDNNKYGGDWWMANQTMERALVFAGYEVNHVWGDGAHEGKQATAIFPDAMRWLWHDWPAPIKAGLGSPPLQEVLIPGEDWQLVGENYSATDGPTANAHGEVFFNDPRGGQTWKVGLDGRVTVFLHDNQHAGGQAFGPDGRLYAVAGGAEKVLAYDEQGRTTVVAEGIRGNDLVIDHQGRIYVTESGAGDAKSPSKVWLILPSGEKRVVDTGLAFANGVTLSPDETLLYVAEYHSRWVTSFQLQPDGSLTLKQRYYHLHQPDTADDSGADGIRVDRDGRLYVTTRLGIQICDQAGRVNCIVPTPNGRVSNLTFGGEKFDTLFATCGSKVYKRRLKVTGFSPWAEPHTPAPPKL